MESHRPKQKVPAPQTASKKRKREEVEESKAGPASHSSRSTSKHPVRKKKSKRVKEEDKAYNPRRSRPGGGGNALHMRIKVKPKNEKIIALYYLENITGIDQDEAAKYIRDAITVIRGGSPLEVRVVERSGSGTPKVVRTPGKTLYYLYKRINPALFFSSIPQPPSNEPVTALNQDNPLFQSESYQNVKKTDVQEKRQRVTITKKQQQAVAREKAKTGKQRNQNKVMREGTVDPTLASATTYAQATGLFPSKQEFEWLHMIAYSILGQISQAEGNLFCGSFHANTDMMFAEAQVKDFVKKYPEGFDLEVVPHMVVGTQLAHHVEFIFHTKDFTLPFLFDTQTDVEPRLAQTEYMNTFTAGIFHAVNSAKTAQVDTDEKEEEEEEEQQPNEITLYETPESKRHAKRSIFVEKDPAARRQLDMDALTESPTKTTPTKNNK